MTDCLFCKIAAREIDADVVAETDGTLAFRDINPAAPTHVLVIPKSHIASAAEMGTDQSELLGEIFETLRSVAAVENLEKGFRIVTNIGDDGGQSVHHLHFHLLGGRSLAWPPG